MISWDGTTYGILYIGDYHNPLQESLSTSQYKGMALNFQTNPNHDILALMGV